MNFQAQTIYPDGKQLARFAPVGSRSTVLVRVTPTKEYDVAVVETTIPPPKNLFSLGFVSFISSHIATEETSLEEETPGGFI